MHPPGLPGGFLDRMSGLRSSSPVDYRLEPISSRGIGQYALPQALLQPIMRRISADGSPVRRAWACRPDGPRSFQGGAWSLDSTTDGVDPQNAQPALDCDRGRDAADAVWRAVSGCRAQGQRPYQGLRRE